VLCELGGGGLGAARGGAGAGGGASTAAGLLAHAAADAALDDAGGGSAAAGGAAAGDSASRRTRITCAVWLTRVSSVRAGGRWRGGREGARAHKVVSHCEKRPRAKTTRLVWRAIDFSTAARVIADQQLHASQKSWAS